MTTWESSSQYGRRQMVENRMHRVSQWALLDIKVSHQFFFYLLTITGASADEIIWRLKFIYVSVAERIQKIVLRRILRNRKLTICTVHRILCDRIKENLKGELCRTYGRDGQCIQNSRVTWKEEAVTETSLGTEVRIIIKRIFKEIEREMSTGFI